MLRLKEFTVPVRPARMPWRSRVPLVGAILAIGLMLMVAGLWWVVSPVLLAYIISMEALLPIREWFWNRYADQCETTFREIGQSADSLAKALKAIAAKIEADAKVREMVVTVDEPETVTVETHVSTTHDVRYWVSESKGSN